MARPRKKPKLNIEDLSKQVIKAVTDMNLTPPEHTADDNRRMYLNLLAEELDLTPLKV